jgi:hypothetical protein
MHIVNFRYTIRPVAMQMRGRQPAAASAGC